MRADGRFNVKFPADEDPLESRKCSAHKKSGEQCSKWAMRGSTVCSTHGGKAPQVKAAAERRRTEAVVARKVAVLGERLDCSAEEALEAALQYTAGAVEFLAGELGEGADVEVSGGEDRPSSLSPTAKLYLEERKALAVMAKMGADIDLEDRKVRIQEADLLHWSRVIEVVAELAGFSEMQKRELPRLVVRAMEIVEVGSSPREFVEVV